MATEFKSLKVNGHVGFDTLSDQLVSKAIARGFCFNILCVGETGLGKSTLMETMFNQKFDFVPSKHDLSEVNLESKTFDLKEKNVKLKLTLVETCGFGDQINKEQNVSNIVQYIDEQYEKYLQEEMKIKRDMIAYSDSRIHACLYFIAPSGHTLRPLDVVAMQQLQEKVNLIPVIAKADAVTAAEMTRFKTQIFKDMQEQNIKVFQFPVTDFQVREQNEAANAMIPFAVVGSREIVKSSVNGKPSRGRHYSWGTVLVDNPQHCDFVKLREMMLRVNMEHLREITHKNHYELYRKQRLISMGFQDGEVSLEDIYTKRRDAQLQQQHKKEEAVRQKLVIRVRDKEEELKERERQINMQHEDKKKLLAEERKRFEEKKRRYEEELSNFERRKLSAEHTGKSLFTMKKKKG